MRGKTVVAFDLYGTLLSTESIALRLEAYFGPTKAQSIAALWRRYQLEYTWRLNCMGARTSEATKGLMLIENLQSDMKASSMSRGMRWSML